MDIIYLVKNDPENDSEELRHSLRSLENIPHGKVYLVGEKPDWATNIVFIPVAQDKTKAENVAKNMLTAAKDPRISENYILMNDDMFYMKKMDNLPNIHFGPMKGVIERYDERYPEGSDYIGKMKKLYEFLRHHGIADPVSYELHMPMIFNKQKVVEMFRSGERLYQFRTYYGNMNHVGGVKADDVKIFLESRHNSMGYNDDPERFMDTQTMLSMTGGAFKKGPAGDYIRSQFPKKSMYEN